MKNSQNKDIPNILYKYMAWPKTEEKCNNYAKDLIENHHFYMKK